MAAGSFEFNVNTQLARRDLRQYGKLIPEAVQKALRAVADALLRDAYLYVPVLSGALRDSGRVQELVDGSRHVAQVVFGNFDVVYAEIQHEVEFNHPGLGFFGAAKYLEKPFINNYEFYRILFVTEYRLAAQGR